MEENNAFQYDDFEESARSKFDREYENLYRKGDDATYQNQPRQDQTNTEGVQSRLKTRSKHMRPVSVGVKIGIIGEHVLSLQCRHSAEDSFCPHREVRERAFVLVVAGTKIPMEVSIAPRLALSQKELRQVLKGDAKDVRRILRAIETTRHFVFVWEADALGVNSSLLAKAKGGVFQLYAAHLLDNAGLALLQKGGLGVSADGRAKDVLEHLRETVRSDVVVLYNCPISLLATRKELLIGPATGSVVGDPANEPKLAEYKDMFRELGRK